MLTLMNESDFDSVYKILKQSFPEDERRSYINQKALLSKKAYKIYVEKD